MTATILMFDEHRRRARPRPEALADRLKDSVTQTIMADYEHLPVVTVAAAIRAGTKAIDFGGNLLDAMQDAEEEIQKRCPGAVAASGTSSQNIWRQQRAKHLPAFLDLAARQLQARLAGRPAHEYHHAMIRARRVLEGGGTIGSAIYHAMSDTPGGAA